MADQSAELLRIIGINPVDALDHFEANNISALERNKRTLQRAVDTGQEAILAGYDLAASDDKLAETTQQLVDDYKQYTQEVRQTGQTTDPEYTRRRPAKLLLLESAVKELARRNGIEDVLTTDNLRAIEEATGVSVSQGSGIRTVTRVPVAPKPNTAREGFVKASHIEHDGVRYQVEAIDPSIGVRGGYVVRDPRTGNVSRILR
jgi:hypothetical protein